MTLASSSEQRNTSDSTPAPGDLRCSIQTAELGESPNGSAGSSSRFILAELPLPWPKPIANHPLLSFLGDTPVMTPDYRILAVHGPGGADGTHRLITYDLDPKRPPHFVGHELTVERDSLSSALRALVAGDTLGELVGPAVQDLTICTQGTHDRCCGLFGTELYVDLQVEPPTSVRIWRTSHTGGHRFAPTAALFPSGQMWAGLSRPRVDAILQQNWSDHREASTTFRGAMGMANREAQIADAAAFAQLGWPWLASSRQVVSQQSVGDQVEVVVETIDQQLSVTVKMIEAPALPIPKCGEPLEAATKASKSYQVVSLKAARTS